MPPQQGQGLLDVGNRPFGFRAHEATKNQSPLI
jgi:hypothetical protein